jgi:GT2 family glycosyltransferase
MERGRATCGHDIGHYSGVAVAAGKLSIVIVGWNCLADVRICLESILACPPSGPFEIIYVDNASSDGSAAAIASEFPGVTILVQTRNGGFQAANNAGLRVATGDTLLLLNPDTRVLPGSLDRLVGFLTARADAGAASPRCVHPDGRVQWTMAPFPSLGVIRHWFSGRHRRTARLLGMLPPASATNVHEPGTQEQAYAYGACLAVKRAVVDAVGPMDERYFLSGGEVAWSREIQRHGWKVFYVADATIEHRESTSRRRRSIVSELDWVASHRRLLYTYEGLRAGIAGDVLFSAHLVLTVLDGLLARLRGGGRVPTHARRSSA